MYNTLTRANVSEEEIVALDHLRSDLPANSSLANALNKIAVEIRAGSGVRILGDDDILTPSEAASFLGMSRPHLYKVLDSGVLPFFVVGTRDRRIKASDAIAYRERLFEARSRRAMAEANAAAIEDAALDEMQ